MNIKIRIPSNLTISQIKKGTYYDAINDKSHDDTFHVPTVEEIRLAIKYADIPFIQNKPYVSSELVENSENEIKSLVFANYYNKYDFREITIEKDSKSTYYFLIKIDY